ncbi:MAG: exopolysaccharide Pel transporter PelG, partial [Anaerolineae bacterium]|nr:exopolysaccharide Pel transporter PelG [Anaerolineae bacterium]
DMLYEERYDRILPSMYGAISICLLIGAIGWAAFLIISNAPFENNILSFLLFCIAVVVWIQMTFVGMAKDYISILKGFGLGILVSLLLDFVLVFGFQYNVVITSLISAIIGYGTMMISFTLVLHDYFPIGNGSSLKFMEWIDKYPSLVFVGFFSMLGLFIHLLIMWASPWGERVIGLFYQAPAHDLPALLAFLTTLVTTINFVTSVEVNFYPKYRLYFSLLNEGGSLADINEAYKVMVSVLKQELFFLAQVQLFVEVLVIVLAEVIIPPLGLGFKPTMISLFRVLCVGYGLFAIGNSMMLFLLYFSNYKDALLTAATLLIVNTLATLFTITLPQFYYGFGFVLAGLCMYLVAWERLSSYINHLDYHIYCKQPIFVIERKGWLTHLARRLDGKYNLLDNTEKIN